MIRMNRTVLAAVVGVILTIPAALLAESLGIDDGWPLVGVALVIGFIVSLVDREGFYGPREP